MNQTAFMDINWILQENQEHPNFLIIFLLLEKSEKGVFIKNIKKLFQKIVMGIKNFLLSR